MKIKILISCFSTALLLILSGQAMAQGGRISFGNLKVVPGVSVQAVHDDNIYLSRGNTADPEFSDWITHVKPGLGFDYTIPERGIIKLGYMGDLAYYDEYDKNDWSNHTGSFLLDYEAPGGLIFGIKNTYTDAEDPYGSDSQYKLGVPNTQRWFDNGKAKLGFKIGGKIRLLAYYNYYKQEYDLITDKTQDYEVNEYGAGIQGRFLPKTWFFIRYFYGDKDYFSHPTFAGATDSNDSDLDWSRVNMGLTWEPGAKLKGELNFGYQWRDYDNERDPVGNKYDDKDTWIAQTSVNFTATPTTTLSLSINRALKESGSNTNEYYEDTGVGLSLKQVFLTKFTLDLSATYSENEYNLPLPKKKDQDNFLGNVALTYQIQDWLSAGLRYTYSTKDSNYETDEYDDNQFMVSLGAVY